MASAQAILAAPGPASTGSSPSCYSRTAYHPENFSQAGSFVNSSSVPKTKGRNVSGRSWKSRPQKRTSSLVTKVKSNNRVKGSWEEKRAEQERRREVKAREKEIKEATASKKVRSAEGCGGERSETASVCFHRS